MASSVTTTPVTASSCLRRARRSAVLEFDGRRYDCVLPPVESASRGEQAGSEEDQRRGLGHGVVPLGIRSRRHRQLVLNRAAVQLVKFIA